MIVDQYGVGGSVDPGTFALVQIHPWAGGATVWGADRFDFYVPPGEQGTPDAWFDGLVENSGSMGSTTADYNRYKNTYLGRHAISTDVTIGLTGDLDTGQTYDVTAEVCIEAGGSAKTMRIYMVQVLDHWPTSPTYHRNGFKQAAATQDITLNAGECQNVVRSFTFDSESWASQANIKIVAWAQVPNASGPAGVHQAAVMTWPFPPSYALLLTLPDGVPEYVPPFVPTDITIQIEDMGETYVPGSGLLHYRYDGGTFLTAALTDLGGGLYEGTLPAPTCDALPEYYFSAQGDGGTTVYLPEDAPTSLYTATVATITTIMADNFEEELGWTVENDASLTDGAWQRGVPADDGVDGDPTTDYDGSGQCYLTANRAGNSDLDGGPTRLISPPFDASGYTNPALRFAYWWSNDDHDSDPFAVDVSTDGGGSWTNMVTITNPPYPVEAWTVETLYLTDYVTPTSTMKVRFSVADVPNNSKDEGGLDAVWIFDQACAGGCTAQQVDSCRDHGAAGRLCLDMGLSGGIEPRLAATGQPTGSSGLMELDLTLDDASGFGGGVTVDCGSCPWSGTASASVVGNVVTVSFSTALPDKCCCTVTLDCDNGAGSGEVCVCGLQGDIDRGGLVTPGDASIIKPKFAQTATAANAQYDYDVSGVITPGDFSQVKSKFGNSLQNPCP